MFEFYDTKRNIQRILDALGGPPSECGWLDYKAAAKIPLKTDKEAKKKFMDDIRKRVVAFLNSLDSFGRDKVILFGISEDKTTKEMKIDGISSVDFPDDNEWQNSFREIQPFRPFVETGAVAYQGRLIGYLWIRADNYKGPYYYTENKQDRYPIRRGGNTGSGGSDSMTPEERKEWEEKAKEVKDKSASFVKTREIMVAVTIGAYCEENENDLALIAEALGESKEALKEWFKGFKARCLIWEPALFNETPGNYGPGRYAVCSVQNKEERLSEFSADEANEILEVVKKVITNTTTQYSPELRDSVMDTLVTLANCGYRFRAKQLLRSVVTLEMFDRRPSWGAQIAEVAPELVLELVSENKYDLWNKRQIREIIQALRVVAWDAEYFERAIASLRELRKMADACEEATEALCDILTCEGHATAADFRQRLDAVRDIAKQDKALAFLILNRSLERSCSGWVSVSPCYVPRKFRRLSNGTYTVKISQYQTYYEELLRNAESAGDILALLPQWLPPFPFSHLYKLAQRIEELEPSVQNPVEREAIWARLCYAPLLWNTGPSVKSSDLEWDENAQAIVPKQRPKASDTAPTTENPADIAPKNYLLSAPLTARLQEVGRRFRPNVPFADARCWFRRETRAERYLICDDFQAVDDEVTQARKNALSEIYRQGGVDEVCNFLQSLPDSYERPLDILSDFPLSAEKEKILLDAFFHKPGLRTACKDYFLKKSYGQDLDWLKSMDAELSDVKSKADFYAALYPREEFLSYFETQLGERAGDYWAAVEPRKFLGRVSYAFERFIKYQRREKAAELLGLCPQLDQLPPGTLFKFLTEQERMSRLPQDVFCRAYGALFGRLDENRLEELEIKFFQLYGADFACFKPLVTFKRLANDPETFVEYAKAATFCSNEAQLLKACDAAPDDVKSWADGIESLCASETPQIRERVEEWAGRILYNTLRETEDGYALNDESAKLLESSEAKRRGFFYQAYYPNGAHISGSYSADAKNLETAKRFEAFAGEQEASGRANLAQAFRDWAKSLIDSVVLPAHT